MAVANMPQDRDLTDEEVQQMLARATQHLAQEAQSKELLQNNDSQRYTFPKLQTGALDQPYVSSNGDIATLDSKRSLEQKHRPDVHGIRKVEDPVAAKKAAHEVCLSSRLYFPYGYEEINSQFFLERSPGTVLVRLSA